MRTEEEFTTEETESADEGKETPPGGVTRHPYNGRYWRDKVELKAGIDALTVWVGEPYNWSLPLVLLEE